MQLVDDSSGIPLIVTYLVSSLLWGCSCRLKTKKINRLNCLNLMLFLYTCWTLLKSVAPSIFFSTPCSGCNNLSLLGSFNPTITKTTARPSKRVTLFGHYPTTWYDVIPPFAEKVNKRWKISLSHSTAELGCSVTDINSQKIFLFLTNWACWNNRHLVWKNANHFIGDT